MYFLKDLWQNNQQLLDFIFPVSSDDRVTSVSGTFVRREGLEIKLLVKVHRILKIQFLLL